MKTMLSGVDLSAPYERSPDYFSLDDLVVHAEHADNLRAALVAALVIIESSSAYEQKYAELAANAGSINQDWRMLDRLKLKASVAYVELETALEPFKVAGDDAKVAPNETVGFGEVFRVGIKPGERCKCRVF